MTSRNLTRWVLGLALGLAVTAAGFAQYPGNPGMGGTSTGGGTKGGVYTAPKGGYSSTTGIAIGAAAAAGVAVGGYLFMRSRRSMVGCVQKSAEGTQLMSEKDKKAYALDAGTLDLKPGDRVKLKGKKTKSDSGAPQFAATKLVKDYGSCDPQASLKAPATP
jgi:hypothetical protein